MLKPLSAREGPAAGALKGRGPRRRAMETGGRGWVGLVLAVGLVWGITYALYPVGLAFAGPLWLAALRFDVFCVGAFAACWAFDGGVRAPATWRDAAAIATYAGLNIVLHNLAIIGGAAHVPVAVVGILAGLTPILTAALAPLALPQSRPSGRLLLGLAAGFGGVAVLTFARPGPVDLAVSTWTLVAFAGFLAWALGAVLVKAAASPLPSLSVGFWAALLSVAILQPLALAAEPLPSFTPTLGLAVLFVGLVGGIGGFVGWMRLVRRLGPAHASLASLVSPAVASVAAAALLGQPLGWAHLAAYVLVGAGLVVAVADLSRDRPQVSAVEAEPAQG